MITIEQIRDARQHGLRIALNNSGSIVLGGRKSLIATWQPFFLQHNSEVRKALSDEKTKVARRWLLRNAQDAALEVACSPAVSAQEVLWSHPGFVSADILTPPKGPPPSPMLPAERKTILDWLASIGETSPDCMADAINLCQSDPEARRYFLARATASLSVTSS